MTKISRKKYYHHLHPRLLIGCRCQVTEYVSLPRAPVTMVVLDSKEKMDDVTPDEAVLRSCQGR